MPPHRSRHLGGRPIARTIPTWGEKGKADEQWLLAELTERIGPERALKIADWDRNTGVFPNLVVNDIMAITVRTFYPVAPDLMNVRSWALAPKGEEPEAGIDASTTSSNFWGRVRHAG